MEVTSQISLDELYRLAQKHNIIRDLSIGSGSFRFQMRGVDEVTLNRRQAAVFIQGIMRINPAVFAPSEKTKDGDVFAALAYAPRNPEAAQSHYERAMQQLYQQMRDEYRSAGKPYGDSDVAMSTWFGARAGA